MIVSCNSVSSVLGNHRKNWNVKTFRWNELKYHQLSIVFRNFRFYMLFEFHYVNLSWCLVDVSKYCSGQTDAVYIEWYHKFATTYNVIFSYICKYSRKIVIFSLNKYFSKMHMSHKLRMSIKYIVFFFFFLLCLSLIHDYYYLRKIVDLRVNQNLT